LALHWSPTGQSGHTEPGHEHCGGTVQVLLPPRLSAMQPKLGGQLVAPPPQGNGEQIVPAAQHGGVSPVAQHASAGGPPLGVSQVAVG
jgi:hypothetical protein